MIDALRIDSLQRCTMKWFADSVPLTPACRLGAWVAFEVAQELRRRGAPLPVHMLVSSKFCPNGSGAERKHALAMLASGGPGYTASPYTGQVCDAPDGVFWDFQVMYGLDRKLASDRRFRAAYGGIFRSDLRLSEIYRPASCPPPGGLGALPIGLTLLRAANDRMLPAGCMDGWSSCVAEPCATILVNDCGHSFMLEARGQPQFVAAVRGSLEPFILEQQR